MAKGTLKKIAIGTAIAGTAGYIVGVLTAPKEGKKTRKELRKSADRNIAEVEKQLKELHTEIGHMVRDAKKGGNNMNGSAQKKLTKAMDNAMGTKDKLRSVLSSIHEGEASDKDLHKAMEDARNSLQHLKDFIKK